MSSKPSWTAIMSYRAQRYEQRERGSNTRQKRLHRKLRRRAARRKQRQESARIIREQTP